MKKHRAKSHFTLKCCAKVKQLYQWSFVHDLALGMFVSLLDQREWSKNDANGMPALVILHILVIISDHNGIITKQRGYCFSLAKNG